MNQTVVLAVKVNFEESGQLAELTSVPTERGVDSKSEALAKRYHSFAEGLVLVNFKWLRKLELCLNNFADWADSILQQDRQR